MSPRWSTDGTVVVHEWLKQAILLLLPAVRRWPPIELGPVRVRRQDPAQARLRRPPGVRVVPGASARFGSFLDRGVVMMPSYVNIGARVGANTMVDTWATVGSCAQIGANVHLSGGVGIGGVLEPPQAAPVMVGDDCLIGSRCIVAEGARVGDGVVLGAGCILTGSIPVIDAETGEEVGRGVVPSWCVAVVGHAGPARSPAASSGCRACSSSSASTEGERHDKSQAQRDPARSRRSHLTGRRDRPPRPHRRARRHPVGQPRRAGHRRPHRGASCAAVALARGRPGSATTSWPAPTSVGRMRLVLAGHTDTVPANGNDRARIDGDTLWGSAPPT